MATVLSLIAALAIIIIIVNVLQNKRQSWLPRKLQNWEFLPLPLRSLQPYDYILKTYILRCKRCRKNRIEPVEDKQVEEKIEPIEDKQFEDNTETKTEKPVMVVTIL